MTRAELRALMAGYNAWLRYYGEQLDAADPADDGLDRELRALIEEASR